MIDIDERSNNFSIPPQWEDLLRKQSSIFEFGALEKKVGEAYGSFEVFPPQQDVFRALTYCAPHDIRVVILGQDPYHTPGVADGLAFSTREENPIPPSLKNIYKEIAREFSTTERTLPDLTDWAKQGVLLLNTSLTVESGSANSHAQIGWGPFTDAVIHAISRDCMNVVFMLWGNNSRSKRALIDTSKHLILESAHPSPLAAHKGFFGNNHFKDANAYLEEHHRGSIQWC